MQKRKTSLNKLLFIYTFMVFIIPILVISVGTYLIFNYYTYNETLSKNNYITKTLKDKLNQLINNFIGEVNSYSEYIIRNKIKDPEKIKYFYNKIYDNYNFIDLVINFKEEYKFNFSYPGREHFYNFDFSNHPVLKRLSYTGMSGWTDVYISEFNNKPTISYSINLTEIGAGIMFININTSNMLRNVYTAENDYGEISLIITDKNNTILFHPDNNKVNSMDKFSFREIDSNKISIDGETYFYTRKDLSNPSYRIYVLQKYSSAFASIIAFRNLILIILLAGLSIAFFSIFYSFKKLFHPIKDITRLTTMITKGNYNIQLHNYEIKELSLLSSNFGKMLAKIIERENILREKERKYRNLVEENVDSILRISPQFEITYISKSIEDIVGINRDTIIIGDRKINDLLPILPDRHLNIVAFRKLKNILANKITSETFVVAIKNTADTIIYIEIQAKPLFDENGEVAEIQATARDITRRHLAERKAEFYRNYFFNILNSMPSVIITLDENENVNFYNKNALNFFNTTDELIKGKKIWDLSGEFEEYDKYFSLVKSNNIPIEINAKIPKNNIMHYFKITIFSIITETNLIVIRIDDVSKLVNTERQLRHAQKLKSVGNMAAGLAHDLNNVLGALTGTLAIIDYKRKNGISIDDDFFTEDYVILKESVTRGQNIIKQLVSITRQKEFKFEIIDLNKFIETVIDDNKIVSKEFGFIPLKESAFVSCDIEMFKNTFRSIFDKLHEFNSKGNIKININRIDSDPMKTSEFNKYYQIEIIDKDSVIPEDQLDNIFDPYFNSKKYEKENLLSLAMAFNAIRNHGGYLDCFSESGKGTTFTIHLPIYVPEEIQPEEPEKSSQPAESRIFKGSGVILVVDDENVIRYTTKRILELCGYTIIEARNGQEGIDIYKRESKNIDCVVLDFFMPDMTGFDVFESLHKINKDVKILLSSGLSNHPKVLSALDSGVEHFLKKPFTIESLSETVYKMLNGKKGE